jgi:low molecular weight phosphotyrosine protein phosphatase
MNMRDLRDMAKRKGKGEGKAKLALFGDFGGERGEEVQDPYYGGGKGFEVAFEQVERFGRGLLGAIEAEAAEKKN